MMDIKERLEKLKRPELNNLARLLKVKKYYKQKQLKGGQVFYAPALWANSKSQIPNKNDNKELRSLRSQLIACLCVPRVLRSMQTGNDGMLE
jgi:hypothetical protein